MDLYRKYMFFVYWASPDSQNFRLRRQAQARCPTTGTPATRAAPSGAWRPQNKSQLEKWQKLMASAETLRAQTIDFAECIPPPEYIPQRGLVRRTHYVQEGPGPVMMEPPAVANKLMDGFLLLEACHVEFPDEATRAVLHSMNVADVAPEDLQYFNNLAYLDLGANLDLFLGPVPKTPNSHAFSPGQG